MKHIQAVFMFALSVAFLINSMALYQREHRPWIIVHNPITNIAEMVAGTKSEKAIRNLLLGGFQEAIAIATASHPYPITKEAKRLKQELMEQFFSPEASEYVQSLREDFGIFSNYAAPSIRFNVDDISDLNVQKKNGGLLFSAHFTQTILLSQNIQSVRTFHVQAFGHLAPATMENPYQVKFSKIKLKEVKTRGEMK